MNRPSLVLAFVVLLGACGERATEMGASNNSAAPDAGTTQADAANPQQPDGANANEQASNEIPAPFRGTWAETAADCGNPAHPGRLVVESATLRFYESIATVDQVEQINPREINIRVTATGEGTTRASEYHYALDAAGGTLTDQAGGGMVRRRCGG